MINIKLRSGMAGIAAGMLLAIAPGAALADQHNGNSNAGDSVTICHATGSSTNPYVRISPNANGVVNGHENHQDGADIIPPFDYNDHGTIKHFPGQNWDANGQAIFNNGCKVPGGMGGGPQKDCDNDFDNSPAADCAPAPQKDCDGDFDNSPATDCTSPQPQKDCDNDFDNSPATECQPGGMGGGPTGGGTTTTSTGGQVLGASTTAAVGGLGAGPQISLTPSGSVNGGAGAGSRTTSKTSLIGVLGSLLSVGSGMALLNRRQSY